MANQEKEVKKEEVVSKEEFTALKAKVRRMSDNWKRFVKTHVDDSSGGTIVALLLCLGLFVAPVMAEDVANWDAGTPRPGTAVLSHDGLNYLLAVDEFAGSGSGLTGFTVSLEDNVSSLFFTNGVNLGTCYLDFFADKHDDAGDYTRLLFPSTGGMLFQSDISAKGTPATKITITSAGAVQVDSTFTASGSIIASADIDSNELDAETATDLLIGKATATGVTIGATDAETTIAGAFIALPLAYADIDAYTVLVANSGHTHIMPDLTADTVITMPAEAAGLYYKFVYCGGAEDAQDWSIDTGADINYFVGGIVQHDVDDGGDDSETFYSDGGSNSKISVLTPAAGTVIEMWCVDGTTWFVSGTLISTTDTGIVFADQ